MENSLGKFIVLEGIDGCGKGTQTKLLSEFLSENYGCMTNHYPEYGKPIGDTIDAWLHKKYEFNAKAQALLYFTDFIKDDETIGNWLKSGKMVVVDRYFTSTIVYQNVSGFSLERMLKLAELFDLRKPDMTIYIKILPETAFARKMEQKGAAMDRHEENKKFLNSLYETYNKMADESIFCDWTVIDGEKSIEEVHQDIIRAINNKLGI